MIINRPRAYAEHCQNVNVHRSFVYSIVVVVTMHDLGHGSLGWYM